MANQAHVRVPAAIVLPLLLFASVVPASDQSRSEPIDIVAMAVDVQTIVVRNQAGRLTSCSVGEVIEGSGWQLAHVAGGQATLQATHRHNGAIVSMQVGVGQRIDARAVELVPNAQAPPAGSKAGQSQPAVVAQDDKR